MWMIDRIAEQKITEAVEHGELDDLPGKGRPLCLDDDSLVPRELRTAYRLLKNSGYLPAEVGTFCEIADVETLLAGVVAEEEGISLNRRLNYLLMQLGDSGARSPLFSEAHYRAKLKAKSEKTRL